VGNGKFVVRARTVNVRIPTDFSFFRASEDAMTARAEAVVVLTALVGLSLSCLEPTGTIDVRPEYGIRLPDGPGDRDVSKLAGTYVNPSSSPRLILTSDGGFLLQYVQPQRTYDYAGRFMRLDSMLVFSFSGSNLIGNYVMSGVTRGDTVTMYDRTDASHQIDFSDLLFVRVREP
jgi:hypothetical protein